MLLSVASLLQETYNGHKLLKESDLKRGPEFLESNITLSLQQENRLKQMGTIVTNASSYTERSKEIETKIKVKRHGFHIKCLVKSVLRMGFRRRTFENGEDENCENNNLRTVAPAKMKLLTAELKGADVSVFHLVARICDVFAQFKEEKYESINDISNIRDADRGQSYRKKADIKNLEVPATSWRIGTSPPASGVSTPFYDPDPDVGQR
ncbi:hypothetical protein Tco_1269531 [Tanacetum coccineum]